VIVAIELTVGLVAAVVSIHQQYNQVSTATDQTVGSTEAVAPKNLMVRQVVEVAAGLSMNNRVVIAIDLIVAVVPIGRKVDRAVVVETDLRKNNQVLIANHLVVNRVVVVVPMELMER
jgi:hypothetical protein